MYCNVMTRKRRRIELEESQRTLEAMHIFEDDDQDEDEDFDVVIELSEEEDSDEESVVNNSCSRDSEVPRGRMSPSIATWFLRKFIWEDI